MGKVSTTQVVMDMLAKPPPLLPGKTDSADRSDQSSFSKALEKAKKDQTDEDQLGVIAQGMAISAPPDQTTAAMPKDPSSNQESADKGSVSPGVGDAAISGVGANNRQEQTTTQDVSNTGNAQTSVVFSQVVDQAKAQLPPQSTSLNAQLTVSSGDSQIPQDAGPALVQTNTTQAVANLSQVAQPVMAVVVEKTDQTSDQLTSQSLDGQQQVAQATMTVVDGVAGKTNNQDAGQLSASQNQPTSAENLLNVSVSGDVQLVTDDSSKTGGNSANPDTVVNGLGAKSTPQGQAGVHATSNQQMPVVTIADATKQMSGEQSNSGGQTMLQEGTKGKSTSPGDAPPQASSAGVATQAPPAEIKLTEPARLAEAQHTNLIDQVARGIEQMGKTDQHQLRLQLYPESMGKIELRLSSGADGVRVVLTADTQMTGDLLQRHMPDLRGSLVNAGVNLAGLSIGYSNSQSHTSTNSEWQTAAGRTNPKFTNTDSSATEGTPAQSVRRSTSNVDYFI